MTSGYLNECPSDMKLAYPAKWAMVWRLRDFFSFAFDFIGDLEHLTSFFVLLFLCIFNFLFNRVGVITPSMYTQEFCRLKQHY